MDWKYLKSIMKGYGGEGKFQKVKAKHKKFRERFSR
jgi:hypothetical protein